MEQNQERKKAIRLSAIGSVAIMLVFYLVAIGFTFVINLITPDTTRPNTDQVVSTSEPTNLGSLTLVRQTTTEATPYRFQVSAYLAIESDQSAQQFNRSVLDQVTIIRQDFEQNLINIFGTVESPGSQLMITAQQITRTNRNRAMISYLISTIYAGDSAATEQLIDQTINY